MFRTVRPLSTSGLRAAALAASLASLLLPGASASAQSSQRSAEQALIDNLVAANRILADQGVLDGFGHISVRSPSNPNRFFMSRSLRPALVGADNIIEFDLDSAAVDLRGRAVFLERVIHSEVYKARPDVNAVVHSHSPAVIPFGISQVPLKAAYHLAAFLAEGVPVFEIRKADGMADMLVRNGPLGKALAESLGKHSVALMRGHGDVVVGPTIPLTVFRAVYTEVNARAGPGDRARRAGDVSRGGGGGEGQPGHRPDPRA